MGISEAQLEEAYDDMLMGVGRKSAVISPESKKLTAFHEVFFFFFFFFFFSPFLLF